MKIVLVSTQDIRNRDKFLSDPLVELGHEVIVCRTFVALLKEVISDRGKAKLYITVGVGLSSVLGLIYCKIAKILFVVRLGGDPVGDIRSRISAVQSTGRSAYLHKIRLIIVKAILKNADHALVVSNSIAGQISPTWMLRDKISVLPQYVRGERIPFDCKYRSPNKVRFLTVTNLNYKEKAEGVVSLIDAMVSFVGKSNKGMSPEIIFEIAGDGAEKSTVDDRISKLSVGGGIGLTVTALGHVSDMDALYRRSEIFLYSSKRDAVPNVLLEARRHGLVCVLYKSDLDIDVFSDKLDGYVVSSVNDLSNAIQEIIDSEDSCNELAKLSEHRLWQKHSPEKIAWTMRTWLDSLSL